MDSSPPTIAPLLVLEVQTRITCTLSGGPLGDRIVFDVMGGTFQGSQLSGRVPASGGDWLLRVGNRSQLDVRLPLETHDGVIILLQYTGRASQRAGQPRIEVAAHFEAPVGPYDWLNDVQAFGLGRVAGTTTRYDFFCFQ
jgi:hypothetical protein